MSAAAENTSFPEFEAWIEANDDLLWAEFHETGAYYEKDYERWLEDEYERAHRRMTSGREKR